MKVVNKKNEVLTLISFIGVFILIALLSFANIYFIKYDYNNESYIAKLSLFNTIFTGDIRFSLNDNTSIFYDLGCDPIGILFFVIFLSGIIFYIIYKSVLINNGNDINLFTIMSGALIFISIILFVIYSYTYDYIHDLSSIFKEYKFNSFYIDSSSFAITFILLYVLFLLAIKDIKIDEKNKININNFIEASLLVVLALILGEIKLRVGNSGGSINLSMLPLVLYSYRHGFFKGIIVSSIVFGVLSNLLDGYGFKTYFLDYFIGYFGCAFSALVKLIFKDKYKSSVFMRMHWTYIITYFIVFIIRMSGSTLSSIIYYNYNFKDALIYNLSYIGPSVFACLVVSILLIKPLIEFENRLLNHVKQ